LLTVASLLKQKGHRYVLEALSFLIKDYPDIIYEIIGEGPEKKRLQTLTNKLGLSKHVRFLGERPRPEVAEFMAGCDVFIMTSTDESFGIVYLEAMSQGKPVIGSRGQGIEDIIENGVNGFLVEPTDFKEIVLVLKRILDNETLRNKVGENARKRVRDNYTWERNAHRHAELYEDVVREHKNE
jgi:teichuronic acid biosynthesis glycosyltransferase TuaC